jgi:hypothetical protein
VNDRAKLGFFLPPRANPDSRHSSVETETVGGCTAQTGGPGSHLQFSMSVSQACVIFSWESWGQGIFDFWQRKEVGWSVRGRWSGSCRGIATELHLATAPLRSRLGPTLNCA